MLIPSAQTIALDPAVSWRWKLTLYSVSFALPLILGGPQLITGAMVNCLLFLAASRLSGKELWPVVMLPSLGALMHGVLFGPLTIFLVYFLPMIWLGNYVLVKLASRLASWPMLLRVGLSSFLKFGLLFLAAQIYWRLNLVPAVFLMSMGYVQLTTALIGGLLASGINFYERSSNPN